MRVTSQISRSLRTSQPTCKILNTPRRALHSSLRTLTFDHNKPSPDRGMLPPYTSSSKYSAAGTDEYLTSKLAPKKDWANEPALEKARRRAAEAGVPDIAVSAMQGQFLSVLAKSINATKILEIGTLWGYSTYFLTRTLPPHGQIDTIEISEKHAEIASKTFLESDLYPFPKIHIGSAVDVLGKLTLPGIPGEEGYDFVFIDADKGNIPTYFKESLRLTRKGGLILVDNAIRRGRITDGEEKSDDVIGLRRLYDWIEADNGKTVLASGIQTVGVKSWDGFVIATKL